MERSGSLFLVITRVSGPFNWNPVRAGWCEKQHSISRPMIRDSHRLALYAANLGTHRTPPIALPYPKRFAIPQAYPHNKPMSYSHWPLLYLCVALCLGACQPNKPPPTPIFSPNKQGIHLLLDDGRHQWDTTQWAEHLNQAQQLSGKDSYVVQLIRSDDLDIQKWQQFLDLSAQYQLVPIIRIATTFDQINNWWVAPTADPNGRYHTTAQTYTTFFSQLDWQTTPHYFIIGNEPNHGNEWSGRPDPAAYARFLADMSRALHRQDPHAFILNAGFDNYTPHTGSSPFADGMWYIDTQSFLEGMITAEPDIFSHLDGWASHPYPQGPFIAPPWEQTYQVDRLNDAPPPDNAPPTGIYNRGVNGYEWELWQLQQYGVLPLPVFITETGWRHTISPYPAAETVSLYYDLAYHGNSDGRYPHLPQSGWTPWLDDPRVVAITPFAMAGNPQEWSHTNWLQITETGEITGRIISPTSPAP